MANFAGNAIIAKAKAIYGKRLKPEDYEELLKMESISEIFLYLKKKGTYSDTLDKVTNYNIHRGQLEQWIDESNFNNLARMVKFVGTTDRKFYELDMIKREIDIVLSSLRSVISGDISTSIRDLPLFFKQHASFDIELLTKSRTFKDLLHALQGTRYFVKLEPYSTDNPSIIPYINIEHELWAMYHEIVIDRINRYYRGKERMNLMDIYQTKVEIENITKIYRLKKFYNADEKEIFDTLITKHIRMSEQRLRELTLMKTADDVLKSLAKSDLSEYTDKDGYVYIEYFGEKIKYNLGKRYMYFSTSPALVYSVFIFLKEIEKANIFNIIEGIRYNVDKKDIRKLLVY